MNINQRIKTIIIKIAKNKEIYKDCESENMLITNFVNDLTTSEKKTFLDMYETDISELEHYWLKDLFLELSLN